MVDVAEVMAFWWSLLAVAQNKFMSLEVQYDCKSVTYAHRGNRDLLALDGIEQDTKHLSRNFLFFSFMHIRRDCNSIAHHLA